MVKNYHFLQFSISLLQCETIYLQKQKEAMVVFSSGAVHRIILYTAKQFFIVTQYYSFLNMSKATSVKVYCWQDVLC